MNTDDTQCPTCGHFRGFRPGDLGFNPDFETKVVAKELDPTNLNPDPDILAEYQEFFGADGFYERSTAVDALGHGPIAGTKESLLVATRRHMAGAVLPAKKDTLALISKTYREHA